MLITEYYTNPSGADIRVIRSSEGYYVKCVETEELYEYVEDEVDSGLTYVETNTPIKAKPMTEPATEGNAGNVLKTDGHGGRYWAPGGSGGTGDYEDLDNRPQINGTTLSGNKTGADLGLIEEPAAEGTAGQVLTTDGAGGRTWATVQGGDFFHLPLLEEIEVEEDADLLIITLTKEIKKMRIYRYNPNTYSANVYAQEYLKNNSGSWIALDYHYVERNGYPSYTTVLFDGIGSQYSYCYSSSEELCGNQTSTGQWGFKAISEGVNAVKVPFNQIRCGRVHADEIIRIYGE